MKNHSGYRHIIILFAVLLIALVGITCFAFCNQIHNLVLQVPNITENLINGKDVVDEDAKLLSIIDKQLNSEHPISNNRSDFIRFSGADYANFRSLQTKGIKDNMIYRSSSPIDNTFNRANEAAQALKKHNIHYIVNLEDTDDGDRDNIELLGSSIEKSCLDYYQSQQVLNVALPDDFTSEQAKSSINSIFSFISKADGPVLICSKDGRDKAGFVCFLLSCLACSTYDYIKADYFQSYYSLVKIDDGQLTKTLRDQIDKKFRCLVGPPLGLSSQSVMSSNLNLYTKKYLQDCGVSNTTIQDVCKKVVQL